MPKMIRR